MTQLVIPAPDGGPNREQLLSELDRLRQAEKGAQANLRWRREQLKRGEYPDTMPGLVEEAKQDLFLAQQALLAWLQTRGGRLAELTAQVVKSNGRLGRESVSA